MEANQKPGEAFLVDHSRRTLFSECWLGCCGGPRMVSVMAARYFASLLHALVELAS